MAGSGQLTFQLPQRPALARADYLVAPCNEAAVAWIDRWPDWPQPVLVVHGPAGSGKTHLARVWRQASGATEVTSDRLMEKEPPALLGERASAVLEDVDRLLAPGNSAREEQLLHLHNLIREEGGQLLLTSREPPSRWVCRLPDLRSRLLAALVVSLGPPDDALMEALLVKLFSDRQLQVSAPVVRYLLPRIERSFAGLADMVETIDTAALSDHREITVPLVRQILEARPSGESAADK